MIQASELRLGNNIEYHFKSFGWDEIAVSINDFKNGFEHFSDRYRPIPLTEQRLIDFGFVVTVDSYELEIEEDWMYLGLDKDDFSLGIYSNAEALQNAEEVTPSLYVKSVHQLQNLYYALTGKELKKDE